MHYSYVAFEGLIGAGKTTLCKRLAADLNTRLVLEGFDDNPFLARFYREPERYAFSVELSFLAQRYHQLRRISEQDLFMPDTITDYSIAKSLIFASVTLEKDEHALFLELYNIMYNELPKPGLIIYLHLDLERVRERIRQRGRSYEQDIGPDYLCRLQERYLDHLQKLKNSRVVLVDIGDRDLMGDEDAYGTMKGILMHGHPLGTSIVSL